MSENKGFEKAKLLAIDKFGYEEITALRIPSDPPCFIIINDDTKAEQAILKINDIQKLTYTGTTLNANGLYIFFKSSNIQGLELKEDASMEDEFFILQPKE